MAEKRAEILRASERPDWMQVVLNQGPPCFHLEPGGFCLRAERWIGHGPDHTYISLHDLLRGLTASETKEPTK